ncbi:TMEM175 family protein [Tengunoibacter tsumagoiensis]|uniref:DUF1211 domain-containing membrane protein n=1 Tax=Tengunoibacter tsumagoiensis TaxID=2014871 RepID=A0A402A8R7_9CHLR|nr:TMEM175 family protein [Tengunoibacter tsumagoiensis]GCE15574.1 hypothetical protein KTT_54330 [Tengunoibacter tsumagoiensis]
MGTSKQAPSKWLFEEKSPGFERLTMLCDGIFAIAMTLLVLDIKLPDGVNFTQGMNGLLSKSLFYLLTFIIVANYWIQHRQLTIFIKRQDQTFTLLTFVFLAFVVFFPVSFNVLVSNNDNSAAVVVFYTLVLAGCGLSSFFLWFYATWKHRLVDVDLGQEVIKSRLLGLLIGPLYFCLSLFLLLIPGIRSNDVFYSWLLLPMAIRAIYLIRERGTKNSLPSFSRKRAKMASYR